MAYQKHPNQVVTRNAFRAHYVQLHEPKQQDNGRLLHSLQIVLPKEDPFWAELIEQMNAVAKEANFPDSWSSNKYAIHDGDKETKSEHHKGCYWANASNKFQPSLGLPPDGHAPLDIVEAQRELYSGAWYLVRVVPYTWGPNKGGRGVSLSLETVRKVRDDESFGLVRPSANDVFADYVDADAQAPEQPVKPHPLG